MRARFDDLVVGHAFELEEQEELFVCQHAEQMPEILRAVDAAVARGRYAAGFVAYEAAPAFDPALSVRGVDASVPTPLACFATYRARRVVPVAPPEDLALSQWLSECSAEEHRGAIECLKGHLEDGWTYQVNLTTRLRCSFSEEPFLLYRQLATAQQSPYNAYLETEEWAIACASPELFFSMADGVVTSRPMKGTAPRGRFAGEDDGLAERLQDSPKERAENLMIVDLIRNDLGRVAEYGSVEVPELFALERYPTVWQLTSTVRAQVANRGIAEVFGALFPCGSVTGAPKVASMALIRELERSARGPDSGAVGVLLPGAGSPVARFVVAIRTATIDRVAATACYGVGARRSPTTRHPSQVARGRGQGGGPHPSQQPRRPPRDLPLRGGSRLRTPRPSSRPPRHLGRALRCAAVDRRCRAHAGQPRGTPCSAVPRPRARLLPDGVIEVESEELNTTRRSRCASPSTGSPSTSEMSSSSTRRLRQATLRRGAGPAPLGRRRGPADRRGE